MANVIELLTNLGTNMVILKTMLIATNTPAFERYALQVTESNAQMIAQTLALDQRYMSTNRVAFDLHSSVDGIKGWIVFDDRYKFEYESGAFGMFCDQNYSGRVIRRAEDSVLGENQAVVARWLRMTNVFAGPAEMARAGSFATNVISRICALDSRLQPPGRPFINGASGAALSFQEFYHVNGKTTPVPLYVFQWRDRSDTIAGIEVSGITSNVTMLWLPPYFQMSRPTNYYQLLGEPVYEGKPLSKWIENLGVYDRDWDGFQPPSNIVQAIRAIGPAAVPHLLLWLINLDHPQDVPWAFAILGNQAQEAIPPLEKLAYGIAHSPPSEWFNDRNLSTYSYVADCLAAIGSAAVPALLRLSTNSAGNPGRCDMIAKLGDVEGGGDQVLHVLSALCQDTDSDVRVVAMTALARKEERRADIIPIYTKALDDSDCTIRFVGARELGRIGPEAMAAKGKLKELADHDPWEYVRGEAKAALRSIDPATSKSGN
jgi:hypothetical protein